MIIIIKIITIITIIIIPLKLITGPVLNIS